MNDFKSHFVFFNKDRSGIFILILFILFLQCFYFFFDSLILSDKVVNDDLCVYQSEIDSLSNINLSRVVVDKKFNPNYITDYKGYLLGMSVEEIDRLHKFRDENKFVNNAVDFQFVTKISDSLLDKLSCRFKFPSWVGVSPKNKFHKKKYNSNLNTASVKVIANVSGVPSYLVKRIVRFRNGLNGFIRLSQLYDVYGLSKNDADKIMSKFQIRTMPKINKININFASTSELSSLVYIDNYLANNIIEERILRDGFKSLDELKYIDDFPVDRLESIKLYLTINKIE